MLVKKQMIYVKPKRYKKLSGKYFYRRCSEISSLKDIRRFKTLDKLCSYVGIVPDTGSSGNNEIVKGITHRSNHYLRPAIVESSWVIIRKDPAMLMLYKKYCSMMIPNKAIIKIAKHLLSRIRNIWRTQIEYEKGILG